MRFARVVLCAVVSLLGLSSAQGATSSYQGLWWASPANSESGWGVNFAHQGDVIFATWFTYDSSGRALWLSASLNETETNRFSGDLYRTTGPALGSTPFNPAQVAVTRVGTASATFANVAAATFSYTLSGITQSKAITPQVFRTLPSCRFGALAELAVASNYGGLWWASPAGSESGWGLNISQQADVAFATWFTYDNDGAPLWLVGPAMARTAAATFSGKLYRTTGPAFSSMPFDAARVTTTEVGSATIAFTSGSTGSFSYTVQGITQVKMITQQVFRDTVSVCTSSDTPALATTTAGVLCNYSYSGFNSTPSVNATSTASWTCSASARVLTANGIPDHAVGTFPNPNNPNRISAQSVGASYTLTPATVSTTGTTVAPIGYALNGVKMDPDTAGTCDNSGTSCSLIGGSGAWRIEALGQASFNFGDDENHAHVQPTGEYHYHGVPEGFVTKLGRGAAMTLIGWARDGFPIYSRYGYTSAFDATSAIKVIRGSYRLKATPDAGRPATSVYAMGTFKQDWEYVAGLGDLDECNGRTGVTPEFPTGIYHYFATDTYPYLQRCVKGTPAAGGPR